MATAVHPPKPEKSFLRGFLFFLLGAAFLYGASALMGSYFADGLDGPQEKIALVKVTGTILDSTDIVRQIRRYRNDDEIKGIIIRIDSPGGAVAPSQEIYDEVLKVRASKKKIYTSMGSLAASGGYYIASASDRIFANPGTLTGSIGVIMAFSNAEQLMAKIGVRAEVIKSGPFKDTGSPLRSMTKKEKRYLQSVVDDVHQQFVEAVAKGRNMDIKEAAKFADGRIFTGRKAHEMNLVDDLGGLEFAIAAMGEALGIEGRPKVVYEKPEEGLLDWILSSKVSDSLQTHLAPSRFPSLQYLWTP